MQLIAWPEALRAQLAARGFRVIVLDSRDVGLSTKVDSARGAAAQARARPRAAPHPLAVGEVITVGGVVRWLYLLYRTLAG